MRLRLLPTPILSLLLLPGPSLRYLLFSWVSFWAATTAGKQFVPTVSSRYNVYKPVRRLGHRTVNGYYNVSLHLHILAIC